MVTLGRVLIATKAAVRSSASPGNVGRAGIEQDDRVIRPRRGLPGSRAVVGGLLVALATVGTFAVATRGDRGPTTRYVVAAHAIVPGRPVALADLRTMLVDLPASSRARAFEDPASLVGSIALGPIEPGELVQSGALLPATQAAPQPELSFAIDPDRAVGGSLRPGERVDVLVTYGSGPGSTTERVVTGARLRDIVSSAGDGVGDARRQTVTLAVDEPLGVLAATNAVRAGEVTLVRTTGATGPSGPGRYSPDPHRSGSGG
ncbi:MAG: hypothetical protein JWN46_1902 [Acidimicrobiales bacterium]|nr:hypothetical protein [Acidimicrobiales bacterium]